jgi:regulatory protein
MTDGQRPGRRRGLSSVDGGLGAAAGESLAPVIPLFGGARSGSSAGRDTAGRDTAGRAADGRGVGWAAGDQGGGQRDAGQRHAGPRDTEQRDDERRDAGQWETPEPSTSGIVDAGARFRRASFVDESTRFGHPSTRGRGDRDRGTTVEGDDIGAEGVTSDSAAEQEDVRERAEALLLRKLRSRSLSISEARSAVREVPGADDVVISDLIDRFIDLGYLNDAVFAEQLVLSAIEKRGEGRRAVANTLFKRGIPRDIADAAIAEMPDDDAERALEFARSKARGVGGKDDDAALRRLAGQLARRGYPSSVALTAARQALREVGIGRSHPVRPVSGVRFTPDE